MLDSFTQLMKSAQGFVISFITAPLAIIVNVVEQVQETIGSLNATLIALMSSILIGLAIRGRILDNKRKRLEIRKMERDMKNEND